MGLYVGIEKKSGGFYFKNGYMKRLCIGYLAITYIPDFQFDEAVKAYIKQEKRKTN